MKHVSWIYEMYRLWMYPYAFNECSHISLVVSLWTLDSSLCRAGERRLAWYHRTMWTQLPNEDFPLSRLWTLTHYCDDTHALNLYQLNPESVSVSLVLEQRKMSNIPPSLGITKVTESEKPKDIST